MSESGRAARPVHERDLHAWSLVADSEPTQLGKTNWTMIVKSLVAEVKRGRDEIARLRGVPLAIERENDHVFARLNLLRAALKRMDTETSRAVLAAEDVMADIYLAAQRRREREAADEPAKVG